MTDRTFGVEIEMVAQDINALAAALNAAGVACVNERYTHATTAHWKLVPDSSVSSMGVGGFAIELVSPVLSGTSGLAELLTVCTVLKAQGCKVNRTCGLHVHFGANDLDHESMKRVVKLAVRNETYIDLFMAPSRRGNAGHYCQSQATFAGRYTTGLKGLFKAIDRTNSFYQLQSLMNPSRYYKLNLLAFSRHGTIEFRQHQGTVEYQKISNWIIFLDAMITEAISETYIRVWNRANDGFSPVKKVHMLMLSVHVPTETRRFFESRTRQFQASGASAI